MKKLLLILLTVVMSVSASWANPGDEIKSPGNIVSGKTYYIKGVYVSSRVEKTIYYGPSDATTDTKISKDPVTDIADALPITFTKVSTDEWTLTTPNGMYVYPHTSNGQSYLYKDEKKVKLFAADTKEGTNKGFKFGSNGNYDFQCNKTAAKLGGYSSSQYGITLIEASSTTSKEETSLSFSTGSPFNVNIGESFTAPTLTATPNSILSSVTFSSSNTSVAEVNQSTGEVTIKEMGTTTITASYAGDETYKSSRATYVINVVDPEAIYATFDLSGNKYNWGATNDGDTYFDGSTYTPAEEGNITLTVYGNVRMWGSTESSLRLYGETVGTEPNTVYNYGKGSITLKADEGYFITAINLEGSNLTVTPSVGTYNNSKWEGKANEVTLVKGSNTPQIKTIKVTYKEAKSFSLTTADTDFYSLYLDYAVTIPKNVTAYTGELNGSTLSLSTVEGTIPAETGVLFKTTEAGTATFVETTDVEPVENNDIKGVSVDTPISDINVKANEVVLVLGVVDGSVCFAKPNTETLGANKAYIVATETQGEARPISIVIDNEDVATGISSVKPTTTNGVAYNLAGQRVAANAKGLVIINGKKYLNK